MFTDIVGYTALSQTNEEATMKLLENHQGMLRPIFSRHGGREVKTIGDAFLVEFESSLEALRCALEVQRELDRNVGKFGELQLRIGIHVGEVIHSGNDVYGDAVNIAARIEPLAEPGGICISRQVFDFVQNKLDAQLLRVGSVELRNVKRAVEIYKVLPLKKTGDKKSSEPLKRRVAVLPFENFSPEAGEEYFADGLTEEMIGTLSKIKELSVISRTSVMQYKGKPKLIPDISRELNAGTILEGSVRKMANRARVSIQMIDAIEDKHVWAESYDRDLQDIFVVQSDIASKVAEALKLELLAEDKKAIEDKLTNSPEANLLFLKGIYQGDKGSPTDLLRAVEYFKLAVEQDPEFAVAYAAISSYLVGASGEVLPSDKTFYEAKEYLARALEINPENAAVQMARGWYAFQCGWDWVEAENAFREAVSINPSFATAHQFYGRLLASLGRFDEALSESRKAYELDPASPYVMAFLGNILWMAGKNSEAKNILDKLLAANPKFLKGYMPRAFVLATEGQGEEARKEADTAVSMDDQAFFRAQQALVYAATGYNQEAEGILENILNGKYRGYAAPYLVGSIYYRLGDLDKGYRWIRRAYEERDTSIPYFNSWPILEANRKDPKFVEMLRQLKLP
jgi:TolB-like protein/Flp pilus assembly protein TadD